MRANPSSLSLPRLPMSVCSAFASPLSSSSFFSGTSSSAPRCAARGDRRCYSTERVSLGERKLLGFFLFLLLFRSSAFCLTFFSFSFSLVLPRCFDNARSLFPSGTPPPPLLGPLSLSSVLSFSLGSRASVVLSPPSPFFLFSCVRCYRLSFLQSTVSICSLCLRVNVFLLPSFLFVAFQLLSGVLHHRGASVSSFSFSFASSSLQRNLSALENDLSSSSSSRRTKRGRLGRHDG